MILETAQILCAVINSREGRQVTPYANSHAHHPAVKWAASRKQHQIFLYRLGIAYGEEIQHRFGRKHASHLVIEGLTFANPFLDQPDKELDIEFYRGARHQGLGIDFTHLEPEEGYRDYLNTRWSLDKRKPVWTNRKKPNWAEI